MLWACTIGCYASLSLAVKSGQSTLCIFLGVCLALVADSGWAQVKKAAPELAVAAAADLSAALKEIGDGYHQNTGVTVKLSFGASGALTQQIQNGAPFDLFFSADMDYPRQLIAAGAADGASLYQYAVGRLVLWVPEDSPLDVAHQGMKALLDASVEEDCDCQSAARAVWPRRGGGFETCRHVRSRGRPPGVGRERLTGGAVRGVRQCAGRVRGAGPCGRASNARQRKVLGGSGGHLPSAGARCGAALALPA